MASVTPNVAQVFPVGTSVGAYPASGWPVTSLPPSGAAVPSATESQTVGSDGTLTFTTLTAGQTYFLGASVSGTWRYTKLVMPGGTSKPSGSPSDPISDVADTELPAGLTNPSSSGGSQASTGLLAVGHAVAQGGGSYSPVTGLPAVTDAWNGVGAHGVGLLGYIGAGNYDRMRTPNVFKSLASTAITAGTGVTIWTPAGGKKIRPMALAISSSAAGQLLLGDNAVGTVVARSPALAAGGIWIVGAADLGNGFLLAAVNNVLKLDGPTGNVAGMVWGTEE